MTRGLSPMLRAGTAVLALSVPAAIVYSLILVGPMWCTEAVHREDGTPGFSRVVGELVSWTWLQILFAYGAMFLFLFATARAVEPACIRSRFLTALYFVGVYLIGVVAGCFTSLWVLPAAPPLADRLYYLVWTPAWLFALFGFLPAYFLGAAGYSILAKFIPSDASRQASHDSVSSA